jgi:hypothetical protein
MSQVIILCGLIGDVWVTKAVCGVEIHDLFEMTMCEPGANPYFVLTEKSNDFIQQCLHISVASFLLDCSHIIDLRYVRKRQDFCNGCNCTWSLQ